MAWLVLPTQSQSSTVFTWAIDYSFVLSQSAAPAVGAAVTIHQQIPANFNTSNEVDLEGTGSSLALQKIRLSPTGSVFYIHQSPSLQPDTALVGLGLAGKPSFLWPVQPGAQLEIRPKSNTVYRIAFGPFKEGEVLDVNGAGHQSFAIDFHQTNHLKLVYGMGGSWDILP